MLYDAQLRCLSWSQIPFLETIGPNRKFNKWKRKDFNMDRNKQQSLLYVVWLLVYLKSKEYKTECNTLTHMSQLQVSQNVQFCIVYYSITVLHTREAVVAFSAIALGRNGLKGLAIHVSSADSNSSSIWEHVNKSIRFESVRIN